MNLKIIFASLTIRFDCHVDVSSAFMFVLFVLIVDVLCCARCTPDVGEQSRLINTVTLIKRVNDLVAQLSSKIVGAILIISFLLNEVIIYVLIALL